MSSEDGAVYIMREGDDGEWVNPTPARTAIVEAVTADSDLDADDLEDLETYVDWDDLRAVLAGEGDGSVDFEVEDVSVSVDASGDISVE